MNRRLTSTRNVHRWLSLALLGLVAGLGACSGGGGGGGGAPSGTPPAGTPPAGTAPPLISGFTPASAAVGQSVTIHGLNFVPGATSVSFNNVAAAGVSAAPTQISVTVPAGATTGRVRVATAGGSATSSTDFIVLADTTTPGVAWTTRRLGAPTGAVAFGAGKFVSAGSDIATSTDLMIWTDRSSLVNTNDVAWDGRQFVAVGMSHPMTSADGLSWTTRLQAFIPSTKEKVAASGSGWVAVGQDGSIDFSADGITWFDRTPSGVPAGSNRLNQAVWTGSQWVVMGESGLIFTSPDGTTWTRRNATTTDSFTATSLAASPSLIVANAFSSATSQQAFYTSPDGVAWTRAAGTAPFFKDMLRVGTRWVGVGTFGGAAGAQWSDDGLNWTAATGRFDDFADYLVHDGTRFVAFSSALSSTGEAYVSPDGTSWTLIAPGDQKWTRIARSPAGLMVAVSLGRVQTSTDGINWTYGVVPLTSGLIDVEWFAPLNKFVVLSQIAANNGLFFSSDGLNWTSGSNVSYNTAIGASPTLLVNVPGFTAASAPPIFTTPDGVNWTARTNPATAGLNEVQWLGDRWIALGRSGTVLTSPDGMTWTARTSGVTAALRRAVMVAGTITVVGDDGTILSSTDGGATWIARTSNTTFHLNDIVWTGAEYVAVGSAGKVVRSTNGVNWTVQPTPYTQTLFATDPYNMNAAVWTGSRIVVVGDRNLVATSP